jgi:hypothetical protein
METQGAGEVRIGQYRHFKGGYYEVLGVARHVETKEELVIYRPDYGDHQLAVRPKAAFLETVVIDGNPVPRFAYVGPLVSCQGYGQT